MEVWREPRIPMQLRVELHGLGPSGPFQENAYTVNVSRSGARLTGSRYSQHPGDTVELRRGKDKARFQVIWVGEPGTPVHGQVGVRSLEPAKNIWSAPLPPSKPVADMCPPTYPAVDAAQPSAHDFSEAAFSAPSEPAAAGSSGIGAADPSSLSLFTRTPFAATEETAQEGSVEDRGDTVRYGPELTPEQYLVAQTPPPLHRRPILYVGLAAALIAGLGLGWLRSRGSADETSAAAEASSSISAPTTSASAPATLPSATNPAPTSAQPAAQPAPTANKTEPAPKKPAPAPAKSGPVETASRTQPAPVPVKTAPSKSPYAVQVGAYGSASTARSLAKKLSARYDRQGVVDPVSSGGKTLHRVRLQTASEADAKALVARIRREQKLDAIIIRPD